MIKSKEIYSPQNFIRAMTGECHIFMHDSNITEEIHKALRKNGLENEENPLWDYPMDEIEPIVEHCLNVVLVDVSYWEGNDFIREYRWFEVPEDFAEEEEE